MPAYIVCYDLNAEGQNYDCIIKKLESYDAHWHMQRSVWIVATSQTALQLHTFLQPCLDKNDKLFVSELTRNAAWSGYSDAVKNWLNKHL